MLRTIIAVILALAVSAAGAQIVNRPVAAGAISNPGTALPATCAVGYVYFKSNSTAGQNLHLCTASNTWTQMTGGNLANPVTPGQGGSGVANSKNLTWSASLTFAGTDATTMTFPTTSATVARTDASNTFTNAQTVTCASGGCAGYNTLIFNGTTTGGSRVTGSNTSGNFSVGVEDTTGGGMFGSTTASAAVFGTSVNKPVELASNNSVQVRITTNGVQIASTAANQLRTSQASVPTCTTNCGTSPSVAGSDTSGIVTMGASGVPASGWVVTFNGTWGAAPSCVVQSALTTMVTGKKPIAVQTSTTTMTVTTDGTAPATSDKYAYHCIGVS